MKEFRWLPAPPDPNCQFCGYPKDTGIHGIPATAENGDPTMTCRVPVQVSYPSQSIRIDGVVAPLDRPSSE